MSGSGLASPELLKQVDLIHAAIKLSESSSNSGLANTWKQICAKVRRVWIISSQASLSRFSNPGVDFISSGVRRLLEVLLNGRIFIFKGLSLTI